MKNRELPAASLIGANRTKIAALQSAARRAVRPLIEPMESRVLMSAGTLDSSFGAGGKVSVGALQDPVGIATQNNGDVIVATEASSYSSSNNTVTYQMNISRLLPAGGLDTSFGNAGVVSLSEGTVGVASGSSFNVTRYRDLVPVIVQPNGGILLGGVKLIKLIQSGALDTSFGSGSGEVTPSGFVEGIAVQTDGKILITTDNASVSRYQASGAIDSSFGSSGQYTFPLQTRKEDGGPLYPTVGGLAVTPAGNVIVSVGIGASEGDAVIGVARLTSAGVLDTSFGNDSNDNGEFASKLAGYSIMPVVEQAVDPEAVALASNGTIYQVTTYDQGDSEGGSDGFLFAYSTDGSKTIYTDNPRSHPDTLTDVYNLAVQPDGKPVISGFGTDYPGHSNSAYPIADVVERFLPVTPGNNAVPQLDTSFGNGGAVAVQMLDNFTSYIPSAIVIGGDGKIVDALAVSDEVVRLTGDASSFGSVSGNVFNDANGDATQDDGEPGLAGQTVYVDLNNDGILDAGEPAIATDSSGNYTLSNVPAGAQIVRQVLAAGSRESYPAFGGGAHVTIGPKPVTGVTFGSTTTAYLSGTVYVDSNGNGKQDSGEPGLAGVTIIPDPVSDATGVSTVTNSTGGYSFTGLLPGSYTFTEALPAGYTVAGSGTNTLTLSSGQSATSNFADRVLVTPVSSTLTGVVIGTPGSNNNTGNTIAKAFDGNLANYYDGASANGNYAGLDLGSPKVITQISYTPRSGYASRMVGGIFQGSDSADFSSQLTTLYTITAAPAGGVFTTVNVTSKVPFRYVRYLSPNGSYGDVAEIRFAGHAPSAGATLDSSGTLTIYGTAGSDSISAIYDPYESALIATVNGSSQTFGAAGIKAVVVAGLAGNDAIVANDNTYDSEESVNFGNGVPLTINGGDGNDNIKADFNDSSYLSSVSSFSIDGGAGDDLMEMDGESPASLYGGDGNDGVTATDAGTVEVHGGEGDDQLNAGGYTPGYESITLDGGPGRTSYSVGDPDDNTGIVVGGENFGLTYDSETVIGSVINQSTGAPIAKATVYFDLNNNGVLDAGDISTTTDSKGLYALLESDPDFYGSSFVVRMVLPAGLGFASAQPQTFDETLLQGEGVSSDNFTLSPAAPAGGSISGNVNAGLIGETIYLDANNNSKLDTGEYSTTVQNNGTYSFTNVTAGAYIIRQVLTGGYTQTSPSGGLGIHITVANGSKFTNENFTNASPPAGGVVSGTVTGGKTGEVIYLDSNNNSKFDSNEWSTTTTATGAYNVGMVPPGSYIIRQVLPTGYTQVTPTGNTGLHITVTSGSSLTSENFTDTSAAVHTQLTGTTIGTTGSNNNGGNTIAKATDGSLSTFFDSANANGSWVGLDLGSSKSISQIAFAPRNGYASRMNGGSFQISTTANFTSGVTTLYTISGSPASGSLTTITLSTPVSARYVRYLSPNGSYGNISEFEVFS